MILNWVKMEDVYKTVAAVSEGIYKEKGSKFISFVHPVYDEEAIKEIVAGYKKRFFDARHHCYAWQIGNNLNHYRVNDDGEPSGTAGKPIHGQIRSFALSNVLVIVVRYFGGVKLGTSGLINAYKLAAQDCLNNSEIVEKTIDKLYRLKFGYGVMNDVMKIFKDEHVSTFNQDFGLTCSIEFQIRCSMVQNTLSKLEKIEGVELELLNVQ